jgi:hypothetical protein
MLWAEGELMADQAIQEIMNCEKAKKAAESTALRAQETYRPMMEEPKELPYDNDTMRDKWFKSRVSSFWGTTYCMHIVPHTT